MGDGVRPQAQAFLIGAQAASMMTRGRRILAVTFALGGGTGSWQPWIVMGSAKAAMQSAVRYFAVALAARGISVNAVSPSLTKTACSTRSPMKRSNSRATGTGAGRPWDVSARRPTSAHRVAAAMKRHLLPA